MLLIPNQRMPENCWKCPCENDGHCAAMSYERCTPFSYKIARTGRQPFCPLVELKPGIRIIGKTKPAPSLEELEREYRWLNKIDREED